MIIDFFAKISRQLYIIPGGYYFYKIMSYIFPMPEKSCIKIIQTPYQFKLKLDISKYLGYKIFWRGAHDWNTIFALKNNINLNDIILDIGANIGEYTLYAASFINENGKVFAFEPVQKMYELLNENIQLNSHLKNKIISIKIGISNQKNTLPIYDEDNTNNEGLYSLHSQNFQQSKKIEDIELDTLDNIVNTHHINRINFIKIDIEGNELFALQGAINTIQKFNPKLMIEISQKNFSAAGYSTSDVFNFLKQLNYNIFLIQKRGRLKKVHSANELPHFCNILAIHSSNHLQ